MLKCISAIFLILNITLILSFNMPITSPVRWKRYRGGMRTRLCDKTCSFRAYICSKNEKLEIPIHVLYFSTTFFQAYGNYSFSIGWLQNISIIKSICISVTVQVCNIKIDLNLPSIRWFFKKLESSMPIKLQWVTNLFLQNQVSNQFSQCMEWIELNFQTNEHLSSRGHFLFILVRQKSS